MVIKTNYSENWDLESIPDAVFYSEAGRRNSLKREKLSGGKKRSCFCGVCPKCKHTDREAERRKLLKTNAL